MLLVPNQESLRKRAIRALQAHEIGHQWFGNLVTQATPTTWLSEGFATWISSKMMDQEQRERVHLSSIVARERLMAIDNRPRPSVRVAVNSRVAARDIYNRIVYERARRFC